MAVTPLGYEIRTDARCVGGTLLTRIPDVIDPGPGDDKSLDGRDDFEFLIDRSSKAFPHLAVERVVSVVWDETITTGPQVGFDEYRIRSITDFIDDEQLVQVRAKGIQYDSQRGGILKRTEATGLVRNVFEVGNRQVSTQVGIVLGTVAQAYFSGVPSYFVAGTIDRPTERITVPYEFDNGWTALKEIAALHGAELDIKRNGTTNYLVHLLDQVGASAPKPHFRVGRSLVRLEHEESSERQATRINAHGGGPKGEEATMAGNAFAVQSVAGNNLTMLDNVVHEDDQLNLMGVYIEVPGGALVQVTDSTAPNVITAPGHGVSPGDIVRLRANASGDELVEVWSPSAEASLNGRAIAALLERQDIPPIDNEVPEGDMGGTYTAGLHNGWTLIGAPTVSENTDNQFAEWGGKSQKVVCNADGDGVRRVFNVSVKPHEPFFTPQTKVYVESGRCELFLTDVTNGVTYPRDIADDRAITEGEGWFPNLSFQHGVAHHVNSGEVPLTTTELAVEFRGEAGSTFYIDLVMVTNTVQGVDHHFAGRASNLLFLAAQDELGVRKNPLSSYKAEVLDLNRLDAVRWPDEPLTVGADCQLTVMDEADPPNPILDVPVRLLSRKWLLESPEKTEVMLETEEDRLVRLQTQRRRRDIRRQLPDYAKRPGCLTGLTATLADELEITWTRPANARVELREAGPGATPQEKFDAGTFIDIVDGSNHIIDEPRHALLAIGEIVADTVSPSGKYGKCPQVAPVNPGAVGPCTNLGPGDAGGTYVSASGSGSLAFHQYIDVDIAKRGFASGDKGPVYSWLGQVAPAGGGPQITDYDAFEICSTGPSSPRRCYVHRVNSVRTTFRTPEIGHSFATWEKAAVYVNPDTPNSDNNVTYRAFDGLRACAGTSCADTDHYQAIGYPGFVGQQNASPVAKFRRARIYLPTAGYSIRFVTVEGLPTPGAPGYGMRLERLSSNEHGAKVGALQQDSDLDGKIEYHADGWFPWDLLHIYTHTDTSTPLVTLTRANLIADGDHYQWNATTGKPDLTYSGLYREFILFQASDLGAVGSAAPLWIVAGTPSVNGFGELEVKGGDEIVVNLSDLGGPGPVSEMAIQSELRRESDAGATPVLCALAHGPGLGAHDLRSTVSVEVLDSSKASVVAEAIPARTKGVFATTWTKSGCVTVPNVAASHAFWRFRARREGVDSGTASVRNLQVNHEPICCAFSPPQLCTPDPTALFTADLVSVTPGTCAGTPNVAVRVDWDTDDAAYPKATHEIRLQYLEERDPAGKPGVYTLVHTVGGIGAGLDPDLNTHTETWQDSALETKQALNGKRGTDAAGAAARKWKVVIQLLEKKSACEVARRDTNELTATAYGYCP